MSDELDYNMKLPMTDERYRIPGLNAFSMSAWSRENEPKEPPRYKVGDVVVLTVTTEVTRVFEDCDGTPLYSFENGLRNMSDRGQIRPATDEEAREY